MDALDEAQRLGGGTLLLGCGIIRGSDTDDLWQAFQVASAHEFKFQPSAERLSILPGISWATSTTGTAS